MGVIGSTIRSAQAQSGRRAALRESFERVQAAQEARDQAIQDRDRQRAGMAYEAHASILGDAEKLFGMPEDQILELRAGEQVARTKLNELGVDVPQTPDPMPGAAAAYLDKLRIDPRYTGLGDNELDHARLMYNAFKVKTGIHGNRLIEAYRRDQLDRGGAADMAGQAGPGGGPSPEPSAAQGEGSLSIRPSGSAEGAAAAASANPRESPGPYSRPAGMEQTAMAKEPTPVEGRSVLAQGLGSEAEVAGVAAQQTALQSEEDRIALGMFVGTYQGAGSKIDRAQMLGERASALAALMLRAEKVPGSVPADVIDAELRSLEQLGGHEGITPAYILGLKAKIEMASEPTFAQKARAADVEFDNLMKSRSILAGGIDRVFRGHEGTDNEKLEWTRRARERMHAMDVELKIADAGELPWRYGVSPEITEEQWQRLEIAAGNVGISRERLDISRLSYDLAVRREDYVESKPTGEAKPDKYGRTDVAAKFQLSPNEVEQYGRFKFSSEVMLNHPEDIRTLMGDANEAEALRGDPNTSDWEWDTENKPKAVEQFKKRIQELNKEWGSGGGAATVSEAGSAGKLAPTVTVGGKTYKKKQCYRILRDRHGGKDLRDFPEVWNRKKDGKAVGGAPPAASIKPGDILYLTPDHWQEVLADGKHVYEMETVGENVRVRTDRTWMPGGGRIQNVYRTGGSGSAKTPSKAGFKKGGLAESEIDALIEKGMNRKQIWDTLTAQGRRFDSKATVAYLNKRGVPEWKP